MPTMSHAGARRRALRAFSTAAALAVVPATSARAQRTPADSTPHARSELCFRGGPIDRCRDFLIVEIESAGRVAGAGRRLFGEEPRVIDAQGDTLQIGDAPPARVTSFDVVNVGLMVNRAGGDAIGGMLQFGQDFDQNDRFGVVARRRLWLSRVVAIDLDLGALRLHGSPLGFATTPHTAYGVTTGGAINYGDLLSATVHVDAAVGHKPQIAIIAGARSGSYVSLVVAAGAALLAAAFAHSLD